MFNKNVFTQTDVVADLIKDINEADYKAKMEALKGNQHKIDKNKNNKVDADDFKILRGEKKVNEEQVEQVDEDKYDRMLSNMIKRNPGVLKTHSKEVKRTNDIESGKELGRQIKKNPGVLKTYSAAVKRDKKMYGEEAEHVDEKAVEEDTSVKIPTPTGTRVLGHRYGNAAKTHRDSMADPFAVVKGPGQKDIENLEKKKVKKEEIDPEKVTTDTLAGRVKGKTGNPFAPKKVMLDVDGNVNEEELDEASFDPLKHVKNPSPAVKTAAKDVKRGSYADRAALMKAGGVKDDRGPRGVTQEEAEQQDEAVEKKTDFMDRQKRLAAASAETQKDPARLKRMSGIPGYTAAMDLAKKTTTKEEVEQMDERELSKGETAEKERIVKGMKKSLAGFKSRYGDKAKSVMYATATKQAKKD